PLRKAFEWSEKQIIFVLVVLFLVSHALGNLMRLNAADKVDQKSAKRLLKEFYANLVIPKKETPAWRFIRCFIYTKAMRIETLKIWAEKDDEQSWQLKQLENQRKRILAGKSPIHTHESLYEWLWSTESFPYPAWQLAKLKLYHPK